MNYFSSLSGLTKMVIAATAVFLLYGYLCRFLSIYFFWESKTVGWTLFWLALILFLRDRVIAKKLRGKSAVAEKIGVGVSGFVVLIKGILFFSIPQTDAYASALSYIRSDQRVVAEVGDIKNVFFVPFGGMSMSSSGQGTTGEADLNFVVKGSKKYVDINLVMRKGLDTDWQIETNR